jgi:cation diffusion facilitator CzcD-associated flavoprotein CzcO
VKPGSAGYRRVMPVTTGIVIAGTGFAGIGMGIALKKAGYHDFVVRRAAYAVSR